MAAFVLRRLFWTIPLVLVVVTIIFFMMRSIGGDPFRHGPLVGFGHPTWAKYSDPKPQAIVDNFARKYGLDLPWYRQYLNYLEGVATFNLGPSLAWRSRTVNEIIAARAPISMELGALAFSWAVLAGVPIGLLAVLRPRSLADTGPASSPSQLARSCGDRGRPAPRIPRDRLVRRRAGVRDPGLGRYFVAAVLARDLPVVMGLCIVLTLAILVANLLVDIAHAVLDPRTRERLA